MFNFARKPGITNLDAILLNWCEYVGRIKRTAKYAIVFLVLITIVVVIAAGLTVSLSSEGNIGNAIKSTVSTAAGVASPINIDNQGVHANGGILGSVPPDDVPNVDEVQEVSDSGALAHFDIAIFVLCLFEAFMITLIGMIFSGAYAEVFLSPINPIKFAPYATIHDGMISIRLWVCYSSGTFLHNVKISLGYTYNDRYKKSGLLFLGLEDKKSDPTNLQTEEYARLTGVWRVDIPLDSEAGRKLLDAFVTYSYRNPVIKVSISAQTDSGEVVGKEARYNRLRLRMDDTFAPYHFESDMVENAEDTPRRLKGLNCFQNFFKIVPGKGVDELDSLDGEEGSAEMTELLQELKMRWRDQIEEAWGQIADKPKVVEQQEALLGYFSVSPLKTWNPFMSYSDWKFIKNTDTMFESSKKLKNVLSHK